MTLAARERRVGGGGSTSNKYLFLMTSREARQTYTGIHMPGERWRQLHVHFV